MNSTGDSNGRNRFGQRSAPSTNLLELALTALWACSGANFLTNRKITTPAQGNGTALHRGILGTCGLPELPLGLPNRQSALLGVGSCVAAPLIAGAPSAVPRNCRNDVQLTSGGGVPGLAGRNRAVGPLRLGKLIAQIFAAAHCGCGATAASTRGLS
jgi:hypothetical protein